MMQDPDELLRQAIYEQSQRGSHYPSSSNSFPIPLPPIPTADDPYVLEDHPMNTVDDDYEIYVDHEDGQRIKSRPKVKKKEIFIGPDGRPLPEDVQEQIRGYGSEDEVSNAFFDELFKIARANSANPESKFIRDPGGSGKLIRFHTPIDLRTIEEKMGGYPFNQI
tara:strand:- start:279 stop:773 length:495 start_codon:yes stop_codon:yes gene_type:complete